MKNQKKHYLIYLITNNINGKIYIGKHETFNIDDDYFGSGKHLKRALEKYGIENFTKTILFELLNEEEMNLLEKCVVTEEFCKREDVYNLNVGGYGSWKYVKSCGAIKGAIATNKKISQLSQIERDEYYKNIGHLHSINYYLKSDKLKQEFSKSISQGLKIAYALNPEKNGMFGKKHSDNTKQKLRDSHLGKKNHMSEKIWICNDLTQESKTILNTDTIPSGWRKGRICKKRG